MIFFFFVFVLVVHFVGIIKIGTVLGVTIICGWLQRLCAKYFKHFVDALGGGGG